jgi:hypothetical protein
VISTDGQDIFEIPIAHNSPASSWEIGQKYSFGIASFEDGAWEFPVGLGKLPREALLLLDLLQG